MYGILILLLKSVGIDVARLSYLGIKIASCRFSLLHAIPTTLPWLVLSYFNIYKK